MEESSFIYRHILLPNTATVERYTSPKSGQRGPFKTPPRDRFRHSEHLLRQLEETRQEALQLSQERTAFGVTAEDGMCLSFESDPGFELKLDSLESARSGIELLTVRKIDEHQWATVFVPAGKQTYFIKKVEDYRDKSTGKTKNPQNQPLVGSISDIRKATLEGLWTDERKLLPGMEENIWWEVWLRKGTDGFINIENFKQFAPRTGLRIGEGEISFPERSILLVFGNIAQMTRSLDLLNCIAEVRKAKDNPEIFMRMTPHEQAEWVSEASERIRPALVDDVSVCILDTGINRSHPLIEGSLANADMHAYDPAWGTSDHHGHGSEMAGLAAIIQAEYPEFWPETVRALMVHSADWTTVMKSRFSPLSNRGNILRLLQLYGYGVPHLTSALKSAANSLTLIVQNELQPYDRIDGQYKTRDIHIHELPWPVDALESLATDTQVGMRVTLSYFIEPNPAERGWRTKHTYHSHGLRFDVKTPTEDIGQFRWRVNRAARDEEDHIDSKSDASEWDLGPQLRSRGSLHSDRWHGTAAALAQRECLAVFPVSGWWKERHHLERWNKSARYCLIITIRTPEMNVDLYTPVLNRIAVETRV